MARTAPPRPHVRPRGSAASRPARRRPFSCVLLIRTTFVVIVDVLRGSAQQKINHGDQSGHEGQSTEQQKEDAAQMQVPAVGAGGPGKNEKQEQGEDGHCY